MSAEGTAASLLVALVLFTVGFAVGVMQKALIWCLLFAGLAFWVLPALVTAWKGAS